MSYILTEIINKVGFITLNSEKTLNSLTLEMIKELKLVLEEWESNPEIVCIFLQGAGEKALCAGGDVKKLHDAIVAQRKIDDTKVPSDCFDFFYEEYQVDYSIHTYPKPVIVWGHGIVMGGGIGLMVGASHRIVTEKSKLAMPEITIGLYPDVGGTWFLNKMPSAYGLYLGLTGARLDGADCKFLGLADYYVQSLHKQEIVNALSSIEWIDDVESQISTLLNGMEDKANIPASIAQKHESFVAQFEGVADISAFQQILLNADQTDAWISAGFKSFKDGSPSSANIIFKQLQDNKSADIKTVFQLELNLSCQCCIHPDFAEGVRALLVDKDQTPKWQPATLASINEEWIDSYFTPLWDVSPLHNI